MKKNVIVGIFYGESFYEITILSEVDPSQTLYNERGYAPRFPLKNALQNFIQKNPEISIGKVFIASRFVEKIFSYKLGGSVAQIVTKGFEKWMALHQKTKFESDFKIEVAPDLSSDEMIFGINEKISSEGKVIEPVNINDLECLIEQLKQKQAKRICIHLINADKNNSHLKIICNALAAHGFEVFDPLDQNIENNFNDYPLWRTNLIEASTQGTFKELHEIIKDAFKDLCPEENLNYFDSDLNFGGPKLSNHLALENIIFTYLVKNRFIPENSDIFHFGNENFSLLSPEIVSWQSPWGITSLKSLKRHDLKIQPTNSFYLNSFEEIEITKSEETFEPGPMSLERGRIPCIYDILNSENLNRDLHKKLKDSFWALVRSSQTKHSEQQTFDEFRTLILDRLICEIQFTSNKETLVLFGNWAEKNYLYLRKQFSDKNILLIKESEVSKSLMIARIGWDKMNQENK